MAAGEPIPSWINRTYGGSPRGGFSATSQDPYHPNTTPDYSGGYNPQIPAEPKTGAPIGAVVANPPPPPPPPAPPVGGPVGAAVGAQPPPPPVPSQDQINAYNDILARQQQYSQTTEASNFFDWYRTASGFDNQKGYLQNQLNRAQGQSGAYQQLGNARAANMQSQYGLANRAADLKLAAMGIDRNAIQDELANLGGQRGLAGTERDQELAYIQGRRGLAGTEQEQETAAINALRGLYGKELQNKVTGLGNKAKWDKFDINQQATGGGTWLSPGRMEKRGRVETQLQTDVEGQNLGYQGQMQDLSTQEQRVHRGYDQSMLSLGAEEQRQERGYRGKLLDLDFREKQANTRDQKLGLIADEVGIDRDQARSALDFGLAQLGYDRYLDSNRLLDALDSGNQAESDAARKMLTDAYQMYTALQSGGGGDALKAMMGAAGMGF